MNKVISSILACFCLIMVCFANGNARPTAIAETSPLLKFSTLRFEIPDQLLELPLETGINPEEFAKAFALIKNKPGFRFLDARGGRRGTYNFEREAAIELDVPPFASIAPVPDLRYPGEVLYLTATVQENRIGAHFRFEKDSGVAEVPAENQISSQSNVIFDSGDTIVLGGRSENGRFQYLLISLEVVQTSK